MFGIPTAGSQATPGCKLDPKPDALSDNVSDVISGNLRCDPLTFIERGR